MPAPTLDIPKRLPLVIRPENRAESTNKDAKLVNCFCEKQEDGSYRVMKRAGYILDETYAAGAGSGMYNWRNDVYAIFGTTFYKNGVAVGAVDGTGGVYRFNQILGTTPKLFFDNGVKAYNYDSGGGLVEITDVDFPSSRVKGSAYLDATMYVMNSAANLRGSDLNDTTNWDALNSIVAQIEPDLGMAVAKQLVYVIAMKQWTTEAFYDAANPTGSPLGSNQGSKVNWGCINADSVQDLDGVLLWLGVNRAASPDVIMMDNMKAQVVSTKPISRLLNNIDYSTIYSWTFKDEGHQFYVLTSPGSNITLVYDLEERLWSQWTDSNGNYIPIVASTYDADLVHLWQHESNGSVYRAAQGYYSDDGGLIQVDIYTPNFDGGTRRTKTCNQLTVVADQQPGSVLDIRSSDDDYQTWSNFRRVDLSQPEPGLDKEGSFGKRAYNLRHRCNTAFRIEGIELQLDIGPGTGNA